LSEKTKKVTITLKQDERVAEAERRADIAETALRAVSKADFEREKADLAEKYPEYEEDIDDVVSPQDLLGVKERIYDDFLNREPEQKRKRSVGVTRLPQKNGEPKDPYQALLEREYDGTKEGGEQMISDLYNLSRNTTVSANTRKKAKKAIEDVYKNLSKKFPSMRIELEKYPPSENARYVLCGCGQHVAKGEYEEHLEQHRSAKK